VGGSIIVVYDRLDSGLVTLVDHNAEADEAADDKAAEDAGEEEDEKEGEKMRVSWWSRVGGRTKRQRQREVEGFGAIVKHSFSGWCTVEGRREVISVAHSSLIDC
jgi:hypothetical protein